MNDVKGRITDEAVMRARRPAPSPRVTGKDIDHIDGICRRFIAASPFVVLASVREDGLPDISPRGDDPGFVLVVDSRTLLIPDRTGNNRLESFSNIIARPQVGLLFMIPGHGDTLRVRGQGRIFEDPERIARFPGPRPPDLVLEVTVETAFLHCARSLVRARLWQPSGWPDLGNVPSLAEAMKAHGRLDESVEALDARFRENDRRVLGEEGRG